MTERKIALSTLISMIDAIANEVSSNLTKNKATSRIKKTKQCDACELNEECVDDDNNYKVRECCFFNSMYQIIFVKLFHNIVLNKFDLNYYYDTEYMNYDDSNIYSMEEIHNKSTFHKSFSKYSKTLTSIFANNKKNKKTVFQQYESIQSTFGNSNNDDVIKNMDLEDCLKKAFVVVQEEFFQYDSFLIKRIDVDQLNIEVMYHNEYNTYEYKKHKRFVQTRRIDENAVKMHLHIPTIYYSCINRHLLFFSDPIYGDTIREQFERVYKPKKARIMLDAIPCGKQQSHNNRKTKLERMSLLDIKCYIKRYGTNKHKDLVESMKTRTECCALIANIPRANELFKND